MKVLTGLFPVSTLVLLAYGRLLTVSSRVPSLGAWM